MQAITGVRGVWFAGTSVLILVGVAIETVRQIESQMLMRHYKGFLE
jgi:preprotein translocase subunit SecY